LPAVVLKTDISFLPIERFGVSVPMPTDQVLRAHLASGTDSVLCHFLSEGVGAQVKKYDWDIDPDDANHPTIYGMRGDRHPRPRRARLRGRPDCQRHRNVPSERRALHALPRSNEGGCRWPKEATAGGRGGLDRERLGGYTNAGIRQVCKTPDHSCKTLAKNAGKSKRSVGNGVTVA
jgi:hypothetical protein